MPSQAANHFTRSKQTKAGCWVLTGPIEACGDGVQEGVLGRNQTPHHWHPGARRAASFTPLRAMALAGSGHEAREELGRCPRRSSQPLEEGAEPRHSGLHGPAANTDPPCGVITPARKSGELLGGLEGGGWRKHQRGRRSHLRTGVLQSSSHSPPPPRALALLHTAPLLSPFHLSLHCFSISPFSPLEF